MCFRLPALQVVFVKEAVAVWPSRAERIMGRLSLVKQHSVMFMAWLPVSHSGGPRADGGAQATTTSPVKERERADNSKGACMQA